MAPFSLMSAGVSLLARSFGLFSSGSSLARCTSAVPAIKSFSTTTGGPPKKPLNSYLMFVKQQQPLVVRNYPGVKAVEIIKKIAQQWRALSPEQKRPFQQASVVAREQFNVELQRYQAQLSPVQTLMQAEERRQRLAKRKATRKKRELTSLGKPKGPRSAFNIYMSEHFTEARGSTLPMKMRALREDWSNLLGYQKQVYMQLAEDDKVRYKNEIKTWEEHMVEIGREDLLSRKTVAARKKTTVKASKKKKPAVKAKPALKAKSVAKASAGGGKSSANKTLTTKKRA